MYCLLTRVAVRCKTERWEAINLEGTSQYEIYIPLENNAKWGNPRTPYKCVVTYKLYSLQLSYNN